MCDHSESIDRPSDAGSTAAVQETVLPTAEDSDDLSMVKSLLQDPLLSDLPMNPTLEEVKSLIAIEEGRAFKIRVERTGLEDIPLVVHQATCVQEIKKLIQTAVKQMMRKKGVKKSINWKYIWRTHCLVLYGEKLLNDKTAVSALGIKNDTVLKFERHIIRREKRSRSREHKGLRHPV